MAFASCAALLVATPHLLRTLGPVFVVTAPLLAAGLLTMRRVARGRTLRAFLLGASIGLVLIFAYGFSPPVLERIGHEMGWPGQSLRAWEVFTAPVYDYCCRAPWFWKIFVIWDAWTTMLVPQSASSAASTAIGFMPFIAALALVIVILRRLRRPGDA